MKLKNLKIKLIKLPVDIEMILYFIREDLKGQKFFDGLNKIGFDSSAYHTSFSELVLSFAGFKDLSDELFQLYFNLLKNNSYGEDVGHEKLTRRAVNVYIELMMEKRKSLLKE